MSALGDRLRVMIAAEGPISVERFMAMALGDPLHGYYMRRDPFGAAGDFVTAPEISQMFGELLGLWAADLWTRMGAPRLLRLIELGPGRGTMMADVLRAARAEPGLCEALDVRLVETSPALAARQRERLAREDVPLSWHARLEDAPPGPTIVLANEFFDALPIRQYVKTPGGWRERLVGLDAQDGLIFALAPAPEAAIQVDAPEGALLELGVQAHRTASALARRLVDDGGCALVVDYGYVRSGLGETLQALRGHAPVDPLEAPGEADLTAHVDFSALARAALGAGAAIHGPAAQGAFLRQLGVEQRAARLMRDADAEQRASVAAGLRRLTDGSSRVGMGSLFKVLAICAPSCPTPAGFEDEP